jgi:hypothetical protein
VKLVCVRCILTVDAREQRKEGLVQNCWCCINVAECSTLALCYKGTHTNRQTDNMSTGQICAPIYKVYLAFTLYLRF